MSTSKSKSKSKSTKTSSKCLKGINYGNLDINSNNMTGLHNESNLFKIPFVKIINSTSVNKSEILVELDANSQKNDETTLCEFRFYIPNDKAESVNEKIYENLKVKNNLQENLIVTFDDLKFQNPRGKYSLSFYENSLKFHGVTFNFKTEYKNIAKAYLLPKPSSDTFIFIASFKQALRQGSMKHLFLGLQLEKEDEVKIKLNLSEDQLKEKFSEPVESEYEGATYEIFTKLFRVITNINIVIPGNFKCSDGNPCVKCSYKNADGNLYFLQKSLIFLPKANIYFRLDDIKSINYHRIAAGIQSKSFDIQVKRKDFSSSTIFTGIDKQEYETIESYFKSKNVITITSKENYKGESQDEYEEEDEGDSSKKKEKKEDFLEDQDDDENDESFKVDETGDEGSDYIEDEKSKN